MFHTCQALIIHCMDFRLGKSIKQYLENQNLLGDTDIISVAGAVKNLVSPKRSSDAEFLMQQIEISKQLHQIRQVILMNHTDCGAYGGRKAFSSQEEEYQAHLQDMKKAKEIILAKLPDLEVKTVLARISHTGEINFETIDQ